MLKLFVWENFVPDYTNGLAFAIAETLEQATAMVRENQFKNNGKRWASDDWGDVKVYPLDKPISFFTEGGQ